MKWKTPETKDLLLRPIMACVIGLFFGGFLTLLTGNSPLEALKVLLAAGFGCQGNGRCAILTTLQYATPLILTGLSAAFAFRSGFFSIGQSGQMLLGAAAANWIANQADLSGLIHPTLALLLASLFGMIYALAPALLKIVLGINEILSTILFNSIAFYLVGLIPSGYGRWIPTSARLAILAPKTKLNVGFLLALFLVGFIWLLLWRTGAGYEIRMSGQNRTFASSGGIQVRRMIFLGMALSGALAGFAGGVEVLGVHYHFVQNFTGSDAFDGVMVALLGFCHPLGIFFSAILLGGVRLAAMTGLSIQMGIPRSIGGMLIAVMVIIMSADEIYHLINRIGKKAKSMVLNTFQKTKNRASDPPAR